jgi:hypothetical protein
LTIEGLQIKTTCAHGKVVMQVVKRLAHAVFIYMVMMVVLELTLSTALHTLLLSMLLWQ